MNTQKIGILGTGDVGRFLGKGLVSLGHPVMLGSRDAKNPKAVQWAEENRAQAGTFADTAKFGDILILALAWGGLKNALEMAGPEHFAGKLVLDATNPLDFSKGSPALAIGHSDSAGEQVQRLLPKAHVVKCFNIVGHAHMAQPSFPGGKPDMFICGNDEAAKKAASELCGELGWQTIDIGGIEGSRYLEPMAMVWITYGLKTGTFNHAFALLRK